MLRAFTRRFERPALDLRRIDRVGREYDRERGYERFHAHCRAALQRAIPSDPAPLVEEGVEPLRVMTEARAARTLRQIRERFDVGPFRKNADRVNAYRIDDDRFTRDLLASALTPEADSRILRFFRSEYFVHWFVVTRAMPRPDENHNSFLWHCDKGPCAHLKLLVYLNGVDEHAGCTEFLDLAATRELARSGYLFGRVADRRADLSSLAAAVGVDLRPRAWRLAAGEALLFQPRNVLHRGVMPRSAPRYMLAICLLPSPVPWTEALRLGLASDLRRDPKWHRDAMDIARRAERPRA